MHTLYQAFIRSAWWNAIESVLYHSMLITHQWLLFSVISRATYGLISILFSIIYLSVSLTNLGFDHAVGAHWQQATSSRQNFITYIWKQLIPTYIMIGVFTSMVYMSGIYTTYINFWLVLIIAAIICVESIKKSGKVLLQLMFKSHITATTDILAIISYISMVWGWYWYTHVLTLYAIFVPLLLSSLLCDVVFFINIVKFYIELSDKPGITGRNPSMIRNRFYSLLSDMSQQLFSGNVLTPLFAAHVGLQAIGVLKLISHICNSLGAIIYNVFGVTSQVLFAHTKNLQYATKQVFFGHITKHIHHILYACIIFSMINFQKIMGLGSTHNTTDMLMVALYFVIIFSQNFFMPYEKLFLNEEKTHYLAAIQLLTWAGVYATIWYIASQSILLALAVIILLRLISYLLLSFIAVRSWSIKPSWQLQPAFGLAAVFCSVAFFWLWQ